mgnify:CR=1 FL=1
MEKSKNFQNKKDDFEDLVGAAVEGILNNKIRPEHYQESLSTPQKMRVRLCAKPP